MKTLLRRFISVLAAIIRPLRFFVRSALPLLGLSSLLWLAQPANAQAIVRVDSEDGVATPTGTPGSTWGNAFKHLQDALVYATELEPTLANPVHLWVRGSSDNGGLKYYPDDGANVDENVRTESFTLLAHVSIYGGFDTEETGDPEDQFDQRDPSVNITILDGDIHTASASDNSFHVVSALDDTISTSNCRLDGFTIRNGRADFINEFTDHSAGGGLLVIEASPKVYNCKIEHNFAHLGGGIAFKNADSAMEVRNCLIAHNTAGDSSFHGVGGGIFADSDLSVLNTTVYDNLAFGNGATGGGICVPFCEDCPVELNLINCKIVANHSYDGGGVLVNRGGNVFVTNCLFNGNVASLQSGGFFAGVANVDVKNCTFVNNTATLGGGLGTYSLDLPGVEPIPKPWNRGDDGAYGSAC